MVHYKIILNVNFCFRETPTKQKNTRVHREENPGDQEISKIFTSSIGF